MQNGFMESKNENRPYLYFHRETDGFLDYEIEKRERISGEVLIDNYHNNRVVLIQ
jgi:hypothetical protein